MKQHLKNVYIISLVVVVIDQFIKAVVSYNLNTYDTFPLIKGFLDINLVHNTGAAFSFFQGGRVVFIVVAILVVLLMSVYISNSEYVDGKKVFLYSLLLGGIIGNLVDRVIHGYVIDYISFTAFNYKFPIFNFADSCIVIAVIIAIIITVREDLWN